MGNNEFVGWRMLATLLQVVCGELNNVDCEDFRLHLPSNQRTTIVCAYAIPPYPFGSNRGDSEEWTPEGQTV